MSGLTELFTMARKVREKSRSHENVPGPKGHDSTCSHERLISLVEKAKAAASFQRMLYFFAVIALSFLASLDFLRAALFL